MSDHVIAEVCDLCGNEEVEYVMESYPHDVKLPEGVATVDVTHTTTPYWCICPVCAVSTYYLNRISNPTLRAEALANFSSRLVADWKESAYVVADGLYRTAELTLTNFVEHCKDDTIQEFTEEGLRLIPAKEWHQRMQEAAEKIEQALAAQGS